MLLVIRIINLKIVNNQLIKKYITSSISRLRNFIIQIAKYNNTWNVKNTNTKYTIARVIKNAFIVRKIIVRNIACINKLEIYKNAKFAKIYTKFSTFNTSKDNLRKKELKK